MKVFIIHTIFIWCIFDNMAQNPIRNNKNITRISKNIAKKEFIRIWQADEEVSMLRAYAKAIQLKFVPIPSFVLSKEAIHYDYSKSIVHYLIPNERNQLEMALAFRKNRFDGLVDCSSRIFYTNCEPCNYDDSKGTEKNTMNKSIKDGFEIISNRQFSFIFSVRHIRNCIWFIENEKVFLLDLDELKVYDPDEYINLKCSDKIIRDLSDGHGVICN